MATAAWLNRTEPGDAALLPLTDRGVMVHNAGLEAGSLLLMMYHSGTDPGFQIPNMAADIDGD